jgi:hypothetical protein
MRVLTREMQALNKASFHDKKLSHAHAKDLRDNLKLLKEWRDGMEKVAATQAKRADEARKVQSDAELEATFQSLPKE